MKRSVVVALGAVALTSLSTTRILAQTPVAQAPTPWVHIRVEEPRKESKVSVNLPLSVVQAAMALAPQQVASHGKIHLGSEGHDLSVADIRKLWKELKNAGEAEIVSVQEKDETVSVARKGDHLQILVAKPSEKESVHVDVPTEVVDALLGGEGEELNIKDAIAVLQKMRGDIVKVDGKDGQVRIWIDERN